MELEQAKRKLENAVNSLQEIQAKRMRAEGQYEAALEELRKLGFDSVPIAVKEYKTANSELETSITELLEDVETFLNEFNQTFPEVR